MTKQSQNPVADLISVPLQSNFNFGAGFHHNKMIYGGGQENITINLDSQKLGLWSGGLLTAEAEGNFIPDDNLRKSINGRSGALMPVNSSQCYPMDMLMNPDYCTS